LAKAIETGTDFVIRALIPAFRRSPA